MSNFYTKYPDQWTNLNYIHPYFKEFATHGSETICAHNINYGLIEKIDFFNLDEITIRHITDCIIQNIKQGQLTITINDKVYYGWWAIVK